MVAIEIPAPGPRIAIKTMKHFILLMAACTLSMGAFAKGGNGHVNSSSHSVRGHTTKSGTYVAPSHATNPNSTRSDNYTHKGNVNPYTGKAGTKD